jgi:hypothetical protein
MKGIKKGMKKLRSKPQKYDSLDEDVEVALTSPPSPNSAQSPSPPKKMRRTHTYDATDEDEDPQLKIPCPWPFNDSPEQRAGLVNRFFFWWAQPMLRLGAKRPLQYSDMYGLLPLESWRPIERANVQAWEKRKKTRSPRFWRSLLDVYMCPALQAYWLRMCMLAFQFTGPLCLRHIIDYLDDPETGANSIATGMFWCMVMFISNVGQSMAMRHYVWLCIRVGMRMRSACVVMVYRKSLRLSMGARGQQSVGQVTNLMSIDSQRIQWVAIMILGIPSLCMNMTLSFIFLYQELGPSCLTGIALIAMLVPSNQRLISKFKELSSVIQKVKDERVELCSEALTGIRVVKMQVLVTTAQQSTAAVVVVLLVVAQHCYY